MKLLSKLLFYFGILSLLTGVGVLTYGLVCNNYPATTAGIILILITIPLEFVALRLSLAIDKKENKVESKEDARKPH